LFIGLLTPKGLGSIGLMVAQRQIVLAESCPKTWVPLAYWRQKV